MTLFTHNQPTCPSLLSQSDNILIDFQEKPTSAAMITELSEHIESFLDQSNRRVLSIQECDSTSADSLLKLFSESSQQVEQSSVDCQKILNTTKDSKDYSLSLAEAQIKFKTMKNILDSLNKQDRSDKIDSQSQNELSEILLKSQTQLQKIESLLPIGANVLLPSDADKIKKLANIPKDEYYQAENDLGLYYEPKVSMLELISWFQQLITLGQYASIGIGFKVHRLYNYELGTMCTLISLKKHPIQQKYETKYLLTQHSDPSETAIVMPPEKTSFSLPSSSRELEAGTREEEEEDMVEIVKQTFQRNMQRGIQFFKMMFTHDKQLNNLQQSKEKQLSILKNLNQDLQLQEMLKKWNFEPIIATGSCAELVEQYHAPLEYAGEADFILLYHKKVNADCS